MAGDEDRQDRDLPAVADRLGDVGRIIKRVGDELIHADRLNGLFEISIDEVAWRKGHEYLTLVGDHREGCVVWGTEGKGQAAADRVLRTRSTPPPADPPAPPQPLAAGAGDHGPVRPLPDRPGRPRHPRRMAPGRQRARPAIFARASRLTAVSMDMTGGYAKSVREHAPQAEIVIDNYHVVALATKALDEVRREHWNELRHAGETGAAKAVQGRPLGAAEEPRGPHRPPGRHPRRAASRRREGPARLGA